MSVLAAIAMAGVAAVAAGRHGALGPRVEPVRHPPTELRPEIWHDALFAVRQVLAVGGGHGQLHPGLSPSAERLEVVTGRFVNRAHDDYVEFLIEAGLPGTASRWRLIGSAGGPGVAWRGWHGRD